MKDFAAQQLTKKQMNEVKGGQRARCVIWDEQGNFLTSGYGPEGSDFIEVRNQLQGIYNEFGYKVSCHEADPIF